MGVSAKVPKVPKSSVNRELLSSSVQELTELGTNGTIGRTLRFYSTVNPYIAEISLGKTLLHFSCELGKPFSRLLLTLF
jgi:hypothetical protein